MSKIKILQYKSPVFIAYSNVNIKITSIWKISFFFRFNLIQEIKINIYEQIRKYDVNTNQIIKINNDIYTIIYDK